MRKKRRIEWEDLNKMRSVYVGKLLWVQRKIGKKCSETWKTSGCCKEEGVIEKEENQFSGKEEEEGLEWKRSVSHSPASHSAEVETEVGVER